jgi:cholesterol transport system auxiliary component
MLALSAALLAGCLSIGGDRAELKVYAPQVDLQVQDDWTPVATTLAIAEPSASTALDSNRIAVRPKPELLQVYAGAIWSDAAPVLVQSALIDALGGSERFRAVGRPTDALSADLLLQLDLRHFEAVYAEGAKAPTVVVELQATLIDQRSQRVLSSRRFRAEQACEDEKLPQVVTAFDAALEQAANALAPWLLENAPKP